MNKDDFQIGLEFYTGAGKWRCADICTRVIMGIKLDQIGVESREKKYGIGRD